MLFRSGSSLPGVADGPELLSYVSGIGPALARAIVEYRLAHGGFQDRRQLLEVKNLKERVFEQSAGFLRIRESAFPLDNSAIHPERYPIVERMAVDCGVSILELVGNEALIERLDMARYADETVGMPTLEDIRQELKKPGRDPRAVFQSVHFDASVNAIDDLALDMILPGVVTNVTRFGAFVDIGVHLDGLVHISKMSEKFVNDPQKIVKVGDSVRVKVIAVDKELKRISLQLVT